VVIPLSEELVHRANKLYEHLEQWQAVDTALQALRDKFPNFDLTSCLLKVVAINALYGTNVYAIRRMASHVRQVMARTESSISTCGPELVEQLADLAPAKPNAPKRTHLSFASKFAHFFVEPERFPILDGYAARMLNTHLGCPRGELFRYRTFVENLRRLKEEPDWFGTYRELDHYLWISGQYLTWRKNPKAQINAELRTLFESPTGDTANEMTDFSAALGRAGIIEVKPP